MGVTEEFFSTYLPGKLEGGNSMGDGVFQFDISDAGTWSLDLGASTVAEGSHDSPGCVITTDRATWEGILSNPSSAIQAFMMGKLKASNIGMATKLQQILA
ncbi:MAG: SCP2 sterol-binding domain-containing protein [Myxococcota bacterium]|nr:SCP2 sterol-binding domain-containing protein [Myxococcota bacterium]